MIWRAENVQDQAQSEINDYFVKAWMESGGTLAAVERRVPTRIGAVLMAGRAGTGG